MCGIFGVISRNALSNAEFSECLEGIRHRGPDGEGAQNLESGPWKIQFGHRRLAILDLEGGRQPLLDEGGRSMITFNGEIYNYLDLRRRLTETKWATKSDTEVALVHLLKHGSSGLLDFDGFFGLGVWDASKEQFLLARDRWGIKPLFYRRLEDGGIAFASELIPLLKLPKAVNRLDPIGLERYLFFDACPRGSVVEGIEQLMPGQGLVWRDGKIQIENYFQWEKNGPADFPVLEKDAPELFWHELKKAVKASFVSDVPVGLLVSGGVDSSLIAAAAAEEFGKGLPAFSIGFHEKTFDESSHAALVAKSIGAEFHVRTLSSELLLERFDEVLDRLDSPLADPSFFPTTFLCELAVSKVKVAVGGDGADELYWGYPTYWAHGVSEKIRKFPGAVAAGSWVARHSKIRPGYQSFGWKMKRLFGRWDADPSIRHLRWMSGTDLVDVREFRGNPESLPLRRDFGRELKIAFDQGFSSPWLDLQLYLPASVLTKVDRASMSCGLEVRPPFLSNDFAAWALRLPPPLKMRGKTGKWILREALRTRLPRELAERPKHGFAIPLFEWMQGPLRSRTEKMLAESPIWESGLLDAKAARELWGDFRTGSRDLQKTFWALLVLDHWMRRQSRLLQFSKS